MMFFVLCYAIKGEEKYFIQIILYIKYIIDKFHKLYYYIIEQSK